MTKKNIFAIVLLFICIATSNLCAQGYNHTWLLGYTTNQTIQKGRLNIDSLSITNIPELRKIPFWETQGNISDSNGDLLMSSNGYFIADATGDTMMNGAGINPGLCTDDYGPDFGMPLPSASLFLPMPNDTNKYVLFHQTCDYANPYLSSSEIYYSVIDITLNGGLGGVVSKNNIIITGLFGWGLTAVRHGNGRDWWIIALSDNASVCYKILLSPNNVQYIGSQNMQYPIFPGWAGKPDFSPDGSKFAYSHIKNLGTGQYPLDIRLYDFDRCSGGFSTKMYLALGDSAGGCGVSFSPNSKYLYVSSFNNIYQFDTDSSNISASKTTVAVNDTFLSAPPVFYTNFYYMYLGATGKIYIGSTSSVLDIHTIESPDSAGLSSNVQLHNLHTNCFFIGVPNHPNYYLGSLAGSPCDSLTSIFDYTNHDFKLKISPNPSDGNFKVFYLLPDNKNGMLEIYDLSGHSIYRMSLPQWSTLQFVSLPEDISSGIYNCVISSDYNRINSKIAILRDGQ